MSEKSNLSDLERKSLNHRQAVLKKLLQDADQFEKAIELFFIQHAMLHSSGIALPVQWSYEDEIFAGMDEQNVRCIPAGEDHSIAWLIWHLARLSETIEVGELRSYRSSVGRRTGEIVGNLRPQDLKSRVDPARLQQIADEGAVVSEAGDLLDYWSKRTIAGLLLMPATRHNIVHLNEAYRIRQQLKRKKGD